MPSVIALTRHTKTTSAAVNVAVSFDNLLASGETFTGNTPAVTCQGLTLANKAVSTSSLTIEGKTVITGRAIQFKASAGTAGKRYVISINCVSDATPAQTLYGGAEMDVVADPAGAVVAAPSANDITLVQARRLVDDLAQRAGSGGMYTDSHKDHAIMVALRYANKRGDLLSDTDTIDIKKNDTTLDFSQIAGFHQMRFVHARIVWDDLERISYDSIREKYDNSESTDQPRFIAFETPQEATIHPTADAAYKMTVKLRRDIVNFMAGDPADIVLDVPREIIEPILAFGAVPILLSGDPDTYTQSHQWQALEKFLRNIRGYDRDGGSTIRRSVS